MKEGIFLFPCPASLACAHVVLPAWNTFISSIQLSKFYSIIQFLSPQCLGNSFRDPKWAFAFFVQPQNLNISVLLWSMLSFAASQRTPKLSILKQQFIVFHMSFEKQLFLSELTDGCPSGLA